MLINAYLKRAALIHINCFQIETGAVSRGANRCIIRTARIACGDGHSHGMFSKTGYFLMLPVASNWLM
jgi:hypothetical protein